MVYLIHVLSFVYVFLSTDLPDKFVALFQEKRFNSEFIYMPVSLKIFLDSVN